MTSTVSGNDTSLKSLRDRPFELLKEMERRSRPVTAASAPDATKAMKTMRFIGRPISCAASGFEPTA